MVDQQRVVPGAPTGGAFGPNAWLVDDMYEEYRSDPASVSESWREFFADYVPPGVPLPAAAGAAARRATAPRRRANGAPAGAQRRGGALGRRVPGGSPDAEPRAPPVAWRRRRRRRRRRRPPPDPGRRDRAGARGAAGSGGPHRRQHGGVAGRTHGHQRADGAGQAARGQPVDPQPAPGPHLGGQGQLHPSHRLRGGAGSPGRARAQRLVRATRSTRRAPPAWSATTMSVSGLAVDVSQERRDRARCSSLSFATPRASTSGPS